MYAFHMQRCLLAERTNLGKCIVCTKHELMVFPYKTGFISAAITMETTTELFQCGSWMPLQFMHEQFRPHQFEGEALGP